MDRKLTAAPSFADDQDPLDARLVEARLEEAAETLRRLPEHRVRGYVSTWPEILRDAYDNVGDADGPTRLVSSPAAIDRMDRTLLWLRWLERDEQRIVWDRANRRPWKFIAGERGIDRTTAWRRWTYALAMIAARLNAAAEATLLQHRAVQHPGPEMLR